MKRLLLVAFMLVALASCKPGQCDRPQFHPALHGDTPIYHCPGEAY